MIPTCHRLIRPYGSDGPIALTFQGFRDGSWMIVIIMKNFAVLIMGLCPNLFHLSGLITVGTFSTKLALDGLTKLDKLLAVGTHPALFTVVGPATIVLSRHRTPSAQRTESRRAAQLTFHKVHPPPSRLQVDELARERAPPLPDRRRLWSAVGRTGPADEWKGFLS
jgi:hypothetical protein